MGERLGRRSADIFHQPDSVRWTPVKGRLGVLIYEHVDSFVIASAENVAAVARLVPAPFLDIARHVIRAVWADSSQAPDSDRAVTGKITQADVVGKNAGSGGVIPLVDGGQALTGEFGVGRCFIPAHTAYRKIILPFRIVSQFPCCWARPAGAVAELLHSLLPGAG